MPTETVSNPWPFRPGPYVLVARGWHVKGDPTVQVDAVAEESHGYPDPAPARKLYVRVGAFEAVVENGLLYPPHRPRPPSPVTQLLFE